MKLELKYGLNPNQKPAFVEKKGKEELMVLNGRPGYINLLDALNGIQLVLELDKATKKPAAASFKHVSPAGVALGLELSEEDRKVFFIKSSEEMTTLSSAYARARGADRMSSFGDFISLSRECDRATALLISREVSDGVIAPSYSPEALEILKKKKKGEYVILSLNPNYKPSKNEIRKVFGFTFHQKRNDFIVSDSVFSNIVTDGTLSESAIMDLKLATIALKYTQSNSVIYSYQGQTVGIGAGQQSRLHCTRLAGEKADKWALRHSEKVLSLPFLPKLTRNEKDNIIEQYLTRNGETDVVKNWKNYFTREIDEFTEDEKKDYLSRLKGRSLSSDGFFPFSDNIIRAHKSGVNYIAEPGGSVRDSEVIEECNKLGVVMCFTGSRLFTH